MFWHIVSFKFKNDISEEEIKNVTEKLLGLRDRIDIIRTMDIGIDVLHREISYDIALTATFDSLDDYLLYDQHPEHIKVKKYILSIRESIVSVDYSV